MKVFSFGLFALLLSAASFAASPATQVALSADRAAELASLYNQYLLAVASDDVKAIDGMIDRDTRASLALLKDEIVSAIGERPVAKQPAIVAAVCSLTNLDEVRNTAPVALWMDMRRTDAAREQTDNALGTVIPVGALIDPDRNIFGMFNVEKRKKNLTFLWTEVALFREDRAGDVTIIPSTYFENVRALFRSSNQNAHRPVTTNSAHSVGLKVSPSVAPLIPAGAPADVDGLVRRHRALRGALAKSDITTLRTLYHPDFLREVDTFFHGFLDFLSGLTPESQAMIIPKLSSVTTYAEFEKLDPLRLVVGLAAARVSKEMIFRDTSSESAVGELLDGGLLYLILRTSEPAGQLTSEVYDVEVFKKDGEDWKIYPKASLGIWKNLLNEIRKIASGPPGTK